MTFTFAEAENRILAAALPPPPPCAIPRLLLSALAPLLRRAPEPLRHLRLRPRSGALFHAVCAGASQHGRLLLLCLCGAPVKKGGRPESGARGAHELSQAGLPGGGSPAGGTHPKRKAHRQVGRAPYAPHHRRLRRRCLRNPGAPTYPKRGRCFKTGRAQWP